MLEQIPVKERQIVDLSMRLGDDESQLPEHAAVERNSAMSREIRAQNDTSDAELISIIEHILLSLQSQHPLRILSLSSDHLSRSIPRPCLHWPNLTPKSTSLTINKSMESRTFMKVVRNYRPPPSLQYLYIIGVNFRWLPSYAIVNNITTAIKRDILPHIIRLAPALVFLRLNVGAAMVSTLPSAHWPNHGLIHAITFPKTVKKVFYKYELERPAYQDPVRKRYVRFADHLRELAQDEHIFQVVDGCDRSLSIQQLVGRNNQYEVVS